MTCSRKTSLPPRRSCKSFKIFWPGELLFSTDPFDWEVVKEKKKIDDETTHKEEKTKKEKDEQAEIDQVDNSFEV